jgi:plastocyanin
MISTFLFPFIARLRVLGAAFSLAIVVCVLLTACGGGQTAAAPTPTPPPTPSPTPSPSPTPTPVATLAVQTVVVQMMENPPGHYIFQPSSVTIPAGGIVLWIDNSDAPHTVTSDPGAPSAFNTTQNVTQGKTFALQFNQAGTYHYHCNIHPTTMKAVVTVTPGNTTASAPATTVVKSTMVQMMENPPGHYIFQPSSVTIPAGGVVLWIDNSDAPHTVTSDPGAPSAFNTTQNVTEGKAFALQFNQAGTYHYHCNIHPTTMKAVVDVTA